jgi:AcrR family transcriptional regulator
VASEAKIQVGPSGFYAGRLSSLPSPRDRICAAVVEFLAAYGHEHTTPQMVIGRAEVTPAQFAREFGAVEEAAIAALEEMGARYLTLVERAFANAPGGWRDKLRAAVYAAAEILRENPVDARFGAYEMMRLGGSARSRRDQMLIPLVEMVDAGRREVGVGRLLTRATAEVVVGSFVDAVVRQITFESPSDPSEYVPEVMHLAVRPYLGSAVAAEELVRPQTG